MLRTALFVVAAAVVASGCGAGDETGATAGAAGDAIEIVASDFVFQPATVDVDEAGDYTFRLVNRGETTHALHVEGGGVSEATNDVSPGESAELRLTLDAGAYQLVCPVGNHAERGMRGTLQVGPTTGGAGDGGGYDY